MKWILLSELIVALIFFVIAFLIKQSAKNAQEASAAWFYVLIGLAVIGVMLVTAAGWGVYAISQT